MTEQQIYYNFEHPGEYYEEPQRPQNNAFKVSGIYTTLLGRQDLNYTSPIQAKYIRKRDRNDKDVNLYRIYHTRNLEHIEEVKQKQLKLKQQEMEAALQHQQLLDKIKQRAAKKRSKIRNRSKSFSSLTSMIKGDTYINIDNDDIKSISSESHDKLFNIDDKSTSNTDLNMKGKNRMHSRPKWSLTSEQNDIAIDQEVDELLDFVNTLEIEDYLENLELQEKLTSIQDRIENFKREQNELESTKSKIERNVLDIKDMESNVSNKENDPNIPNSYHLTIDKSTKNMNDTIHTMQSEDMRTSEIADQILNSSQNIKNIHSKQSITSILDNTKKEQLAFKSNIIDKKNIAEQVEYFEPTKNEYNEPRISIIRDRLPPVRERQNLNGNDINNLPYLYRHPGV